MITPRSSATLRERYEERDELAQLGTYGIVGYSIEQAIGSMRTSENRMVCVPITLIKKLQETDVAELARKHPQNPLSLQFLTEGDVSCAWRIGFLMSGSSCSPNQTITLKNAFDIRKVLRKNLTTERAIYIPNAIGFINELLSARDVLEKPLAYTALAIRNAITELGT